MEDRVRLEQYKSHRRGSLDVFRKCYGGVNPVITRGRENPAVTYVAASYSPSFGGRAVGLW
jgi:hypothetical protein